MWMGPPFGFMAILLNGDIAWPAAPIYRSLIYRRHSLPENGLTYIGRDSLAFTLYIGLSFLIVCLFEPPAPIPSVQAFFCPYLTCIRSVN